MLKPLVTAVLCAAILPHRTDAQAVTVPSTAAVIGINAFVGGLTAAAWAVFTHRDAARAFGLGALGGMTHFAGKYVASRRGTLSGWSGLLISGTGTSIVANASAGVSPLEELSLPVASLRVRVRPRERHVRVSINAYETATIARYAIRGGLKMSWARSVQTGTLVMVTEHRDIVLDGRQVDGVTTGPAIAVEPLQSPSAFDAIWKHEGTHVLQNWFGQDAWGRPIERALRKHVALIRRVPDWIDFGVAYPLMRIADAEWEARHRGLDNIVEAEAYFMQRP